LKLEIIEPQVKTLNGWFGKLLLYEKLELYNYSNDKKRKIRSQLIDKNNKKVKQLNE